MRKSTVRKGIRAMTIGILFVMAATFFSYQLSQIFFQDLAGEAHVTLLGFFLGGIFGGCGVVITAAGLLLPAGPQDARLRLGPAVLALIGVILLFVFLVFNSFNTPPPTRLQPGESVTI